jgi:hypothetical protein
VQPQRSTSNQSSRDPAAKDTIGLHSLPRSARESVNAFCLPPAYGKPSARQAVFDLLGRNAGLEIKCNARRFIHPELNDGKEAVGLIVREKSEPGSGRQSFAKGNGAHPNDFVTECQVLAIRRSAY